MSSPRRILLVGATGLVGRKVIARGRDIPGLALVALARRELQLPRGARMEMMLSPPPEWPQAIADIAPDVVICALGTTRAKDGEDGQRKVDFDLVASVAEAASAAGADQFVLVSAVGADPHSKGFYQKIKGQAEEHMKKLHFRRLDILRPSLLLGKRLEDRRPAEWAGQVASPLFNLFLQGERSKYRAIDAKDVAAAALQAARTSAAGSFLHEYDGLMRLAKTLRRDLADGQ